MAEEYFRHNTFTFYVLATAVVVAAAVVHATAVISGINRENDHSRDQHRPKVVITVHLYDPPLSENIMDLVFGAEAGTSSPGHCSLIPRSLIYYAKNEQCVTNRKSAPLHNR